MITFLFRPLTLIFIAIYIGFVFWLLSRAKDKDLSDFPWGNIYLENANGKQFKSGDASYHFYSADDSYLSFENYDHFKRGFYYQFLDGSSPPKFKFTEMKFNKFFRTLSAVCDFQSKDNDYLHVYFDHYIYKSRHEFSRASGFQIDADIYQDSLPFNFPNGAKLILKASSNNFSDEILTDIFFRFENQPYPLNEPSFETEIISINSKINTYEISIPKLSPEFGYSSVLMYIKSENTALIIKDLVLEYQLDDQKFIEKLIFTDAFGNVELHEPYNMKDTKWIYKFKFSQDYSKINGGYLEIHSEGYQPWKDKYGSDWYYTISE